MHLPNKQCSVNKHFDDRAGYTANLWDNDEHPKRTICLREKDV